MCFVHKHMQNADFGQILCRRASTKRCVTSWPMVRFLQTWYQKMRKTWKKKVMKRCVAICGGRGFHTLTPPPPPVKIGLSQASLSLDYEITNHWLWNMVLFLLSKCQFFAFDCLNVYTVKTTSCKVSIFTCCFTVNKVMNDGSLYSSNQRGQVFSSWCTQKDPLVNNHHMNCPLSL